MLRDKRINSVSNFNELNRLVSLVLDSTFAFLFEFFLNTEYPDLCRICLISRNNFSVFVMRTMSSRQSYGVSLVIGKSFVSAC